MWRHAESSTVADLVRSPGPTDPDQPGNDLRLEY
jgi:hypothetical protein